MRDIGSHFEGIGGRRGAISQWAPTKTMGNTRTNLGNPGKTWVVLGGSFDTGLAVSFLVQAEGVSLTCLF